MPLASSPPRMNASIGLRTQAACFTVGTAVRTGGTYAQCPWYSAPWSIHCLSRSFWAAESVLCLAGGGMSSSASSLSTRATSSLSSGLPGTMAWTLSAEARSSSRSFAFRLFLSGPWQA